MGRRWFTSTHQDMAEEVETIVRRDDSVEGLLAGLVQGDRYALARAITLGKLPAQDALTHNRVLGGIES